MAGVAAGVLVAEQVLATGIEASAAVAVAKPTPPPKALLTHISWALDEDKLSNLARSHHTVTVVDNKAYVFGGISSDASLCSADVHVVSVPALDGQAPTKPELACYPPFPVRDAVSGTPFQPSPRASHAASAWGRLVVIHGGRDAQGNTVDDDQTCLWLWDTEHLKWSRVKGETPLGGSTMSPWYGHNIFVDDSQEILILHGGMTGQQSASPSTETWKFDLDSSVWTSLPAAPTPAVAAALVGTTLYTVSHENPAVGGGFGGAVHFLHLPSSAEEWERSGAMAWQTVDFPANPLTPGPSLRSGAALVPITTGMGRQYLAYLFGVDAAAVRDDGNGGSGGEKLPAAHMLGDMWALQLPSNTISAAMVKDAIRDKLPGMESGQFTWNEIQVVPAEQKAPEGKAHPGPRAAFGLDACRDGRVAVMWGGLDAQGKEVADGWAIQFS